MKLHTGTPWWPLRGGLVAAYPPLATDAACEVVVLGAGITGALVAHRLVEAGVDTLVIDGRDAASGSTAATTALLQYETDTELHDLAERVGIDAAVRCWRLGREAIDELETLAGAGCDFARRDSLYLAARPSHAARLAREEALRRRHGFDVELWDEATVRERSSFGAVAALHTPRTAELDGYRLTHRLLGEVVARGGAVYDRTRVTGVERRADGGFALATERGGTVRARRIVVATGYEADAHLPEPVARLRSTFALVTEPLASFDGWPARALVWESARPYCYLRSTPDGRAIIGGFDVKGGGSHRYGLRRRSRYDLLADRLRAMLPQLEPEPAFGWAGTFAETADGMPYIGAHPERAGYLFALGYGGNGITFSAIAARILTDLHLGRPNPDAALFRFGR